jgi:hypothetical protein
MLENVDSVDWAGLGYAEMASWLRDLASDDEATQEAGFNALYDHRVEESLNVAPYVVPFLIELLSVRVGKTKRDFLTFLMQIASETSVRPDNPLYSKVFDALERYTTIYLDLLDTAETRGESLELLGYLRGKVQVIAPKLLSMIDLNQSKFAAIFTLNNLLVDNEIITEADKRQFTSRFESVLSSDEDNYVRLAAAMLVISLLKEKSPGDAIEIISWGILNADSETRAKLSNVTLLIQTLLKLGNAKAIDELSRVFPSLEKASYIFEVLVKLLNLGFNEGKFVNYLHSIERIDGVLKRYTYHDYTHIQDKTQPIQNLNPTQRQILSALLKNDHLWEFQTNIFELHGLPSSREDIRNLIASSS